MQPQIVFSDLDGTFVAEDKTIPSENLALLDELYDRGILFVPCTGRSQSGIDERILNHKAVNYAVSANGAIIYNTKEKCIAHTEQLGWKRALDLYNKVKDRDITFDVFAEGKVYVERKNYERLDTYDIDKHNLKLVRAMRTPVDYPIEEFPEHISECDRVTIMWKDLVDRDFIISLIESNPTMRWTRSGSCDFEISDTKANKGQALVWLCEHLGIPQSSSLAFGDSPNDLTMLMRAGVGVAMRNADVEAIKVANYKAPSNDEAGVAQFTRSLLD